MTSDKTQVINDILAKLPTATFGFPKENFVEPLDKKSFEELNEFNSMDNLIALLDKHMESHEVKEALSGIIDKKKMRTLKLFNESPDLLKMVAEINSYHYSNHVDRVIARIAESNYVVPLLDMVSAANDNGVIKAIGYSTGSIDTAGKGIGFNKFLDIVSSFESPTNDIMGRIKIAGLNLPILNSSGLGPTDKVNTLAKIIEGDLNFLSAAITQNQNAEIMEQNKKLAEQINTLGGQTRMFAAKQSGRIK